MRAFVLGNSTGDGSGRFAKSLIGLVCAVAMLFTGMFAVGTAQAADADDSSGDVTLDWNWDGHTPDGVTSKSVPGTRNGSTWVPDVVGGTELWNELTLNDASVNAGNDTAKSQFFYGWNSKKDGSGDWYEFRYCNARWYGDSESCGNTKVEVLSNDGKLLPNVPYPADGVLYAQWMPWPSSSDPSPVFHLNTVNRNDPLSTRFFAYGWKGKLRTTLKISFAKAPFRPQGIPSANFSSSDDTLWYFRAPTGSANISFADIAKANPTLSTYIENAKRDGYPFIIISDFGSVYLGDKTDVNTNVEQSPRFVEDPYSGWNSLAKQGDVRTDLMKGLTATDVSGRDITGSVKVFASTDPTKRGDQVDLSKGLTLSEPGAVYWLTYVAEDSGYTGTTMRSLSVVPNSPDFKNLTDVNRDSNLLADEQTEKGRIEIDLGNTNSGRVYTVSFYGPDGKMLNDPDASAPIAETDFEGKLYFPVPDGYPDEVTVAVRPWNDPTTVVWDSTKVSNGESGGNVEVGPSLKNMTDVTIAQGDDFDPMKDVTAVSEDGKDLTGNITVNTGEFDKDKIGIYEIKYHVTDPDNTVATENTGSRVITVVPKSADSLSNKNRWEDLVQATSVTAGGTIDVNVGKQYADKKATIVGYSAPTVLAQNVTVGKDGYVHDVVVPEKLKAGEHHIVAVLENGDTEWDVLTVTSSAQPDVPVSKVTVSGNQQLAVGGTAKLTAAVEPDNASDKSVAWSSSDESVATVAADGTVTAVKAGTATITATANDGSGVSGSLEITVSDKSSGSVDKSALDKAIADVEGERLNQSDYTAASWAAYATALKNAKTVQADENATAGQVADAAAKLTAARKGLVKSTPSQPSQPSRPSTPSYPAGLEVAYKPDKTEYRIGEKFDTTGMVVKYQGHVLGSDQYTVSFDSSKPGKVKAVVTLDSDPSKTVTVEVTVVVSDVTVHRLYNPRSGEHFYVSSETEYNALVRSKAWRDEGAAFTMADYGAPVYRLYNPGGKHLFTTSERERDVLVNARWRYEGVAFYVRGDAVAKTDVHRLYNPGNGDHLLTTGANERGVLLMHGWRDEGTAFTAK